MPFQTPLVLFNPPPNFFFSLKELLFCFPIAPLIVLKSLNAKIAKSF